MSKEKTITAGSFISQKESVMLQGFAVSLMVWHHLFGFPDRVSVPYVLTFDAFFHIETLASYFGRICIAVFAFCSGYGMEKKSNYAGNVGFRGLLENYKSTGTRIAMPWKASTPEGADRWRRKKQTEIDAPKVLKNIPKDPRKEKLFILLDNLNDTELLTKIRQLADNNMGIQETVLVFYENGEKQALKMPFKVDICSELLSELKGLVGEDHIKVV